MFLKGFNFVLKLSIPIFANRNGFATFVALITYV